MSDERRSPSARRLEELKRLPETVRRGPVRPWKRAPLEILRAFRRDQCYFLAAGISFYFMLSLIPMLMILLALIGNFLRGSTSVAEDLLAAVHAYIPFLTQEIIANIEAVIANPALLGWIGGAALFLSTDLVFVAVQFSLDRIFIPGRRSFLRSKMLSVLLAVMVFLVVLGTIAVNAVDRSLAVIEMNAFGGPGIEVGLHLSTWVIGILLIACFTLAIRVLPHAIIPLRYAFWGGIAGSVLWLMVKFYYVWYLENVSKVGPLFGSLSAVIMTLLWVYMSALVFLLGAEFTAWLVRTDPRKKFAESGPGDDSRHSDRVETGETAA
ncbi:MAG: YihY/virulence factor BrkB family protein [Gemmatimonadota bacterium]|jgi:membrane protein|nr:hypothetical protein [Gemmatimonadota bacterium]MDP6529710.1 YihY/virulence factor BrkB family protein [Gemmatimonadota bacterium]MDP6802497.1 YihY/virulence factor BrkB family protein [Gemmatimonadota bacterium]MDP7030946.1 YihY/virulence factor BrkB family protein [Gemmatimonadota bacterium]